MSEVIDTPYPKNWPEIARAEKERAGWKCERCGMMQGGILPSGKVAKLQTAHLGETKRNRADCSKLIVLCQPCHRKEDAAHIKEVMAEHHDSRMWNQAVRNREVAAFFLERMPPDEKHMGNRKYRKLTKKLADARKLLGQG